MRCFVLMPAYNERRSLEALIPSIDRMFENQKVSFTIVIADDASSDGSAELAKELALQFPIQLIRHPVNKGYGAALRSGFVWLASHAQPEDVVVSMDADTTHDPSYIPAFLAAIRGGADVVTASYVAPGASVSGVPPLRRLMSSAANGIFQLAFPKKGVHTYTNGFRAYRMALIQKLCALYHNEKVILENGFAGGTELFIKALKSGASAAEVPFNLHYERRGSDSKIRLGKTIRGYLLLLWRLKGAF